MDKDNKSHCSRREFTAAAVSAAAFTIVPRHVLGGPGFTPPSDKINLAVIGMGQPGNGRDDASVAAPRDSGGLRLRCESRQ